LPNHNYLFFYLLLYHAMKIDSTKFGSITINGQFFPYDVYILPTGKIEKRNKKESPRINGHRSLGIKELEYLLSYHPEILFIGMGQSGVLPIQKEAEKMLEECSCQVIQDLTPKLLSHFNQIFGGEKKVVGIFHTTC
jgi:hypothetical protein